MGGKRRAKCPICRPMLSVDDDEIEIKICYLSSLASGLSCEEEITGVLCSFLFSSEVFSPLPGSSGQSDNTVSNR